MTGRNLTLCELQRAINNARSKDFIPDCKDDGEFEEVQCQLNTGECWCVDKAGIEIPDSRTPGLPHCHETIGKACVHLGNAFPLTRKVRIKKRKFK